MTLGQLIRHLKSCPQEASVWFRHNGDINFPPPGKLCSWRGDYSKLTWARGDSSNKMIVKDAVAMLEEAVYSEYTGYKGGIYKMKNTTCVWADDYGECEYMAITGWGISANFQSAPPEQVTVYLEITYIGEYM